MPHVSTAEISMRHFPDISDVSVQIPTTMDDMLMEYQPEEFELAFDAFDDDEFGGLDADPFTTPMSRSKHPPLTIGEIAPQREAAASELVVADSSAEADMRDPQQVPAHAAPRKKESCDDMFERRKRDSYQHMGIDLSAKSTARLRRAQDDSGKSEDAKVIDRVESVESDEAADVVAENPAARRSKATSRLPTLERSAVTARDTVRLPSSSLAKNKKPKSILKNRKPTSSSHKRPEAERPRRKDVVDDVQQNNSETGGGGGGVENTGGSLVDVLMMYGEKLKSSLGLSSLANTAPKEDPHVTIPNSAEIPGRRLQNETGVSSRPLTPAAFIPSQSDNREPLTLSQLSPSRQPRAQGSGDPGEVEPLQQNVSPMRPSTKRASPGSPRGESKREKMNLEPLVQFPEFGATIPPTIDLLSRPRALGTSRTANGVPKNVRLQARTHSAKAMKDGFPTSSKRHPKDKRTKESAVGSVKRNAAEKRQRVPPSLTVPSPFNFSTDVSHKRSHGKGRAEEETREESQQQRETPQANTIRHFPKPAPPARPTVRTTVPIAFNFKSDARAAKRNAEFEEKRKTWEMRTARRALPAPDFAAIHAMQADVDATRVRRAVPVLPTEAPSLSTMARAKEREKFEEERRGREREVERLRAMREQEKAELEEKEYREARKRTVPRAHEIPEWYKEAPRRKEVR